MIAAVAVSLTEVGGVADGRTLNTDAFARGMERVSSAGGGVLRVPKGVWLTGPIEFKSGVELNLADEALVVFTSDHSKYPIVVSDLAGEKDVYAKSPLTGTGLRDVAITGRGVFDGAGDTWRPLKKAKMMEREWQKHLKRLPGFVTPDGKMWYPSEIAWKGEIEAPKLMREGVWEAGAYEKYRDFLRPKMVRFISCTNLTIRGVTFMNSPMWTINPVLCKDVHIDSVQVRNVEWGQNTDSIDIESCEDVVVKDCEFSGGDDGICLKSGKEDVGYRIGVPCRNIHVERCKVFHGHGGFVIGSEMSGGVSNVVVKGCTFIGTETGLRFKTARGRGGVVENIEIKDIVMKDILHDALTMTMSYDGRSVQERALDPRSDGSEEIHPFNEGTPVFRDIRIEGIRCFGAKSTGTMTALPESPVAGFVLKDAIFAGTGARLKLEHFKGSEVEAAYGD